MSEPKKKKDFATAILLNFFVPGAGYFYAGRPILGVVALLVLVGLLIGFASTGSEQLLSYMGGLGVIAAVDGYLTVKKHNTAIEESSQARLVACPHCAEKIQPEAKVCRFCNREVGARLTQ